MDLVDALGFSTHAEIDRFLIRFGMEDADPGGGIEPRTVGIIKHLVDNSTKTGPSGDNLILEVIEYLIHQRLSPTRWSDAGDPKELFPRLVHSLKLDGYVIEDGKIRAVLPESSHVAQVKDELLGTRGGMRNSDSVRSIEEYLQKEWTGPVELFRLRSVARWIDYQSSAIPPAPAVQQVLDMLESERFIRLVGPMGAGKSTTVFHVGFRLANQGWTVLVVVDAEEFFSLWNDEQTWQTLRIPDKDNSLIIIDDIHLVDRETIGKLLKRARQELSYLKFLLSSRPLADIPGRRYRTATELSLLPTVECNVPQELIAALIQMRIAQLQLPTEELNHALVEELADRCSGDLFILTRLLRLWDGSHPPPLASIAGHIQADLRDVLAAGALGADSVATVFVVACLYEVELETPAELLTDAFGIPWQTVSTLVKQQELVEVESRLKFTHASQACLVREAVEQSAVLKSAVRSIIMKQLPDGLRNIELRLVPFATYMLHNPRIATKVLAQITSANGKEADLLELWRQPALEESITTALEHEVVYFYMGWWLFEVAHAIYEVDPPDVDQQTRRLADFVRSLAPILTPKLARATADEVIDFLLMPMIFSVLINPLLEILASIKVEGHVDKLQKAEDAGTVGLYLDYIFSGPAGAKFGSRVVAKSFDHLLCVAASSKDAEGIGRMIWAVGHVDVNLSATLLGEAHASIKADACDFVLQRIRDGERWNDLQSLRASSLIFGKGDAPEYLLKVMEHLADLEPDDIWVRTMYGRAFAQLERFAEAECEFRAALAIRGDYRLALESLSTLLLESGREEEAQGILNELRQLDELEESAQEEKPFFQGQAAYVSESLRPVRELSQTDKAQSTQHSLARILHISDIHRAPDAPTSNRTLLGKLTDDVCQTYVEDNTRLGEGEPRLGPPDLIVVSGDLTQRADEAEFEVASRFMEELLLSVDGDRRRVILVPGNHDINWEIAAQSYTPATKDDFDNQPPAGEPYHQSVKRALDGTYWRKNEATYTDRFKPFKTFFDAFYQGTYTYSLARDQMYTVHDLSECLGLVVVGFNSCDEIDAYLSKDGLSSLDRRAFINTDAIYNAQHTARSCTGRTDLLHIAVFHHNIRSVGHGEDFLELKYLQILKRHGFDLCLHGHAHTVSHDLFDATQARVLPVVGAGSLAAPYTDRPPAVPMGYNMVVVDHQTAGIWVHVRRHDEGNLVWAADHRSEWEGKPYFEARASATGLVAQE